MRRKLMGDSSSVGARRGDLISAAVSGMNDCHYCGTAHAGGLVRRKDYSEDEAVRIFHDWRSVDLAEAVSLRFVAGVVLAALATSYTLDLTRGRIDWFGHLFR